MTEPHKRRVLLEQSAQLVAQKESEDGRYEGRDGDLLNLTTQALLVLIDQLDDVKHLLEHGISRERREGQQIRDQAAYELDKKLGRIP